jgi:sugar diacid utilization regulator
MDQRGIATTVSDIVERAGFSASMAEIGANRADEIRAVTLWHPGFTKPQPDALIVIPHFPNYEVGVAKTMATPGRLHFALCGWPEEEIAKLPAAPLKRHSILNLPKFENAVDLIRVASGLLQPSEAAELRHLTSLQRSFSRALEGTNPLNDLLARLSKTTGAVCAIVDANNRVLESTGSLPLSAILEQVSSNNANFQHVAIDGWGGLAIGLSGVNNDSEATGWMIAASQRPGFPAKQDTAATHIAASLADTARKMRIYAERQQNVIRASIFEEALDLRSVNEAPELTNRIVASGIDFDRPLRVVIESDASVEVVKVTSAKNERGFAGILVTLNTSFIRTGRDSLSIYLVQTDADSLLRTLRANRNLLSHLRFSIGREVSRVSDIAESFADGLLGQKTLEAKRTRENVVSFEDFDFATRLFADVGLAKLARSSREFLAPVLEKTPLFDALLHYFVHGQNANKAADALGVHHNTLRYRLSKVEEIMEIRLNEPSSIASIFLALTALDLVNQVGDSPAESVKENTRTSTNQKAIQRRILIESDLPTQPKFGAKFGLGLSE